MKALLSESSVTAFCNICKQITSFLYNGKHIIRPQKSGEPKKYTAYCLMICDKCKSGALLELYTDRYLQANDHRLEGIINNMYPIGIEHYKDAYFEGIKHTGFLAITQELEEAEKCIYYKLNRAAAAILRSTLEKIFIYNGYKEAEDKKIKLSQLLNMAFEDGIITLALREEANRKIRAMANVVLHSSREVITDQDVMDSYDCLIDILASFYRHRIEVEKILESKGRKFQ